MGTVIWIAQIDSDNYRSFKPLPEYEKNWLEWVDKFKKGDALIKEWKQIEMDLFEGDENGKNVEGKKPIPDFAMGYVVRCCSEKARRTIAPLVKGQVEFLPLTTPVGTYYEMNIQRIECLDVERSTVKRFKDGGILRVIKYSFLWDCLEGQHIFWAKGIGTYPTFVSDEFKRLVEENGLTGLLFHPVPLAEEQ